MREILFRGKRLDNREWVEGSLISWSDGSFSIETGKLDIPMLGVVRDSVGQYIGLTDKNGKRIFEGDIVRHYNDSPYAISGIDEKGEVYWADNFCGWRRTSNGVFHQGVIETYKMASGCTYEVIGNIHDNPELLKAE